MRMASTHRWLSFLVAATALATCGDAGAGPGPGGQAAGVQAARVIAFAGGAVSLAPRARLVAPITVEPALPPGLALDRATGAVRGAARAAAPGRVHVLRDAGGREATLWVEILPRPSPRNARFVAPGGDDGNPGSLDRPYRTVARGARELAPGMTLYLRAGVYRESLELRQLAGTAEAPIQIRSYPGEHAVIDSSEPLFAETPGRAWVRAKGPGAHPDEWVSTRTFSAAGKDSASRGAFLDRPSYTRLLTYSRIEDLRSASQTWDHVARDDRRPGPATRATKRDLRRDPARDRPGGRNRVTWTFFGPGVYFDKETGLIHIRLSPTAHGVAGLEEYRGTTDPRKLHLAISSRADRALGVAGSQHLRISDLGLHHGGDETVRIEGSSDVVLDHVEIRAATYGLFLARSERVRVLHSRIDGGIPPWSFRSDFKGDYKFDLAGGERASNNLVRKTQRALLFMAPGNVDVEIAHSELEDGHDIYVAGTRTDFHHNRIHNVHDEALYLQAMPDESGLRIHHNVIEKTLSALSFAGRGTGPRYVYRNLFDLRVPTAGVRPTGSAVTRDAWRYGHPFKNTGNLGTLFYYQNTVVVSRPAKTPFLQFSAFGKDPGDIQRRWFLNNVFVVLQPGAEFDRAVSFIPPPAYLALRGSDGVPLLRSDGNLWVRIGSRQRPLFRCAEKNRGPDCGREKFWRLADASGSAAGSGSPSFETHSREAGDPGFRRARRLDQPSPGDDLRPGKGSPALSRGIALPRDFPDPERPTARGARPDAGALRAGQAPLRVGVDSRLAY
jgi:hypothetical protein